MHRHDLHKGVAMAGAAYVMWGLFPAFFRLLPLDPIYVLAHRGLWAGVIAALLCVLRRAELRAFWRGSARRRQLAILAGTAALLASNWGVYIHAVTSRQVLQASLGYFVCPLVTVVFGVLLTKEPLRPAQWGALSLAAAGVLDLVVSAGTPPWLALYLAASFGAYGLLRKNLDVDPLLASAIEMLLMAPFALGYLLFRPEPLLSATTEGALLCASGAVTAAPLMLFAAGAKRLPYVTMGLLQYVTPSLQLVLAVLAYGEPLGPPQVIAFGLIWSGLALSTLEVGWRVVKARL